MYRCSIIACARWETPYIAEWIAYYESLGFGHIYLVCNDDDPAELHAEVRAATAHNPDFVSFTHFPGQGRQAEMYIAAMEQARDETEWVAFLDIDEFLVLRHCDNIETFMAPFFGTVDSVHFNWIYFGNSGFVKRPPGSVLRQYTRRSPSVNASTKHLSRVALLDRDRLQQSSHPPFWHGLADPVWSGFRRVNVVGADMAPLLVDYPNRLTAYLADPATNAAVYGKAVVNHYAMKSEEDFLFRVRRGLGAGFAGQKIWGQAYESGDFKRILNGMNQVEDTYLHDLSLGRKAASSPPAVMPQEPLRRLPVRHHLWTGHLALGANGRLMHMEHRSLGSYYQADDVLHVRWDKYPSDLFIERDGVFTSIAVPTTRLLPLDQPLAVQLGATRIPVEAVILGAPPSGDLVEIRPGTTDHHVFRSIFISQEYRMSASVEPVDVVMDLGANTGLASIFFAQQFPRARVIAVEPDPDNFRLLQRNAAGRPRILPIQAAAWAEDTTLYLQKHDASGNSMGAWGVRTIVAPTNEAHAVEALSIATLMRRAGVASIDILKVDIEGAELELFSHNVEEWLSGTRCVIIETHNRFRPGSDQRVSERLAADFQELQRMGENRVFLRRSAG